jgi:hypothetical protein
MNTVENALAIAANLNALGKKASAYGMKAYGHNHVLALPSPLESARSRPA